MLYDRTPFTPWKVEVIDLEDELQFRGFYRTSIRGREAFELFSLIPAPSIDDILVQVRIYSNGDILTWNLAPVNVVVYKRKKLITIELLFDINYSPDGTTMSITPYPQHLTF